MSFNAFWNVWGQPLEVSPHLYFKGKRLERQNYIRKLDSVNYTCCPIFANKPLTRKSVVKMHYLQLNELNRKQPNITESIIKCCAYQSATKLG